MRVPIIRFEFTHFSHYKGFLPFPDYSNSPNDRLSSGNPIGFSPLPLMTRLISMESFDFCYA
jgi:hypothetical protein